MGWTWYLANDVQFHYVIAPILFIAFAKNIRWGLALGTLMLVASSIVKLWIIFENDFPPAPILTAKLQMYEIACYNPFCVIKLSKNPALYGALSYKGEMVGQIFEMHDTV
ncbi:hypothetical protein ANCCAN_16902 [Ancylostoma caninum]|uniref:Uncharacterized protein n=1 Tax=Ancylostoma caninum TaxID=29170 RepID=A0A368FYE1_ANCCA|nr:hypothetical protein ANCCAN_16902 [Ancylostoma caninum]